MKVFTIAIAVLVAVVAAVPVAVAAQEPTTIERIIAQEQAKGLLDEAPAGPVARQEEGRRMDPRITGTGSGPGLAPAVVVEYREGFDWGSAGIGAVAAFAAALLAVGGVVLVRDTRRREAYGEGRA